MSDHLRKRTRRVWQSLDLAAVVFSLASAGLAGLCVWIRSDVLLGAAGMCWLGSLMVGVTALVKGERHPTPSPPSGSGKDKYWPVTGCLPALGIAIVIVFVAPAVEVVRTTAFEGETRGHLKTIVLACHHYADEHDRRMPPAVLRDKQGRPLHSWRVLLLPYLDEKQLFDEFQLDEPWDSPHNLALLPRMPKVYQPVPPDRPEAFTTPFQVFVGPRTPFEVAAGPHVPDDFPDGTAITILVVEARETVPWTAPDDLPYSDKSPLPLLGRIPVALPPTGPGHILSRENRTRVGVAFADGSVSVFSTLMPEWQWRRAIRRDDGEGGSTW